MKERIAFWIVFASMTFIFAAGLYALLLSSNPLECSKLGIYEGKRQCVEFGLIEE